MSRPLRSTPTPASRSFTATTGRSASERRIGTQCLRLLPRHAPSRDLGAYDPGRRIDARLLTFRARAADQARAASTPGTTWPRTRAPARLISKEKQGPSISMPSQPNSTPQRRHPTEPPRIERFLERLPGPHLTRIKSRLFPDRSPRRSSANAASGWFSACPRGPTLEGQQASISRTAPPMDDVFYTGPPSAFVTHCSVRLVEGFVVCGRIYFAMLLSSRRSSWVWCWGCLRRS